MKARNLTVAVTAAFASMLIIGTLGCTAPQTGNDTKQPQESAAANQDSSEDEKGAVNEQPTNADAGTNDDASSTNAGDAKMVEVNGKMITLEEAISQAKADDPFVADEVCLSCHGQTREAMEQRTIQYKDSNPHGGTHGNGGTSCGVCHSTGNTKPSDEENMCLDCHAWPREEQSRIQDMDL